MTNSILAFIVGCSPVTYHPPQNCHPEAAESLSERRATSFFVYIMSNRSKTLCTGITNNLLRRVWEHKHFDGSEFCKHYKLDRLVYFEPLQYVGNAIDREKQIKGLLRIKKIALTVSQNPTWSDLSANWYDTPPWIKNA